MGRYIRKSPKQKRFVYTGRGILARLKEQILNIKKMENKINIAELLKDCPKGMELDCTMYENVTLIHILEDHIYPIKINTPDGLVSLTKYGCYSQNKHSKCVIFPKGKTTWEGLIEPKFKAGDRIVSKNKRDEYFHILHVAEHNYILNIKGYCLEFKDQDNFELVPNKFDVSTLKPFDRVLVRDNDEQMWTADMFSFYNEKHVYPFMCIGHYTNQCIPYDQNKHLLGTTNKCDDYYKTWE